MILRFIFANCDSYERRAQTLYNYGKTDNLSKWILNKIYITALRLPKVESGLQ